jgi:hypothetical protein
VKNGCISLSVFEPGEVINSSDLPTQRSLFVTSMNMRIQCVYSGSEQNLSRFFVTFLVSTDLYKETDRIILSYLSAYFCYFSRVAVVTDKSRGLQRKYA